MKNWHGRRPWMGTVAAVFALSLHALGGASERHRFDVPAGEAFERGQGAWGVKLDERGAACLYDRVLAEDDGPGIGSDAEWLQTDRAPATELSGNTRVKKVLHLERLGAQEAWLYAPPGLAVEVNGQAIDFPGGSSSAKVPVSRFKPGDNDVVLYCPGGKRRQVKFATLEDILRNAPDRQQRPHRSFKSTDGGKTWAPIPGEYMVRLHLVQYVAQGSFISQVVDLGHRHDPSTPLLTPVSIESVALEANAQTPKGTRIELAVRTGPGPVYETASWTDWQPMGAKVPEANRYLQWQATLFTSDPASTPRLQSVGVEARVSEHPAAAWRKGLQVTAFHNEEVRYTSIPFEYEDPRHPRMAALRQKYRLDEVVAGAATETERLARLRDWVAHQWAFKPPEANFPPWDADVILTGKYGFCVQYAIVLMQCATSLGHQARFVFGYNPGAFDGGGHEVCEIWSNEHRKWMFFDVNQDWHYVEARTLVPHSMLEMHDLVLQTYYGGKPAALANPPARRDPLESLALCWGTNMTPGIPPKNFEFPYIDGRCTVPTRWLFIHYMPRNNFFAKPYPQPKTQGAHWDWSEYWCWEDALTPKRWLYRNFTARRSDLEWTLNQVCFDATALERPGAVALQMGTFTPYFDTFLVRVDQQAWKASSRSFAWQLHPGRNRVEMKVRNQSQVKGPPSFLELEYRP